MLYTQLLLLVLLGLVCKQMLTGLQWLLVATALRSKNRLKWCPPLLALVRVNTDPTREASHIHRWTALIYWSLQAWPRDILSWSVAPRK